MVKIKDNEAVTLISGNQTVTGTWANLGDLVDARDLKKLALWLKFTVNDAQNVRVRAVCKRTEGDSESFVQMTQTVGTTEVKLDALPLEFNADANTSAVMPFEVDDLFPFVQFQVQAGTAGSTGASVTIAQVTGQRQNPAK